MSRIDIEKADVDNTTKVLITELRTEIDSLKNEIQNLKDLIPVLNVDYPALEAQQAQINYVLSGNNYEERWNKITDAIKNLK
jgi:hypothetical protein